MRDHAGLCLIAGWFVWAVSDDYWFALAAMLVCDRVLRSK